MWAIVTLLSDTCLACPSSLKAPAYIHVKAHMVRCYEYVTLGHTLWKSKQVPAASGGCSRSSDWLPPLAAAPAFSVSSSISCWSCD